MSCVELLRENFVNVVKIIVKNYYSYQRFHRTAIFIFHTITNLIKIVYIHHFHTQNNYRRLLARNNKHGLSYWNIRDKIGNPRKFPNIFSYNIRYLVYLHHPHYIIFRYSRRTLSD